MQRVVHRVVYINVIVRDVAQGATKGPTSDVEEVSSGDDAVGDVRREYRMCELEERSGEEDEEKRRHD